mmetsp:Transcript_28472/g.58444  ORF Transcript_28472/g.58444 Transcript_28472/m.58444 type:complete len:790 (+) Transcript_28472:137-2506(+)|eukprot:CAMPEP_0171333558 /NCGR_PEP_ID=MMETSP0878-20121228/4078_1 /TAXON_ID=67004 /ORGANISM="Thalassiosira weissflogii, Strain CCMP1336" /LENGTH=789 /DNA_ID=CAMNT_0011834505 /DNA_START=129 /DNA_END=2498 /DNA_ORIENTATION=+
MTNALHLFSFLAAAVSPRVDYAEAQQQRQLRGIFDIDRVVDPHIIPSVDGPGVLASDGDDFSNGGSDGSNPCATVIAIDYLPIPKEDVDGRLLEEDGDDIGEEFVCELENGYTVPITGSPEQLSEMRARLNDGTFVSAENSVEIDAGDASMLAASLVHPISGMPLEGEELVQALPSEVSLAPGPVKVTAGRRRLAEGRRLAQYNGDMKVLVVRVIDKRGRAVPEDARGVSDKWFGTYGDSVTFKSQIEACSFNQFKVSYDEKGGDYDDHGVVEVEIGIELSTSQSNIRNAVRAAVEGKTGKKLNKDYDFVAYVLEKCYKSCGWAAYAYINSWNSVYQNRYFKFVGVQIHEIGHNLNLAHSGGLDGRTYTDHTGMMGNPLYSDNVGKMCYNPAKNYQISYDGRGWYDQKYIYDAFPESNGGHWRGTFVGVGEYDKIQDGQYIVAKIESGGSDDLFVGFNRAAGVNADNDEADDLVTIIETGNNGQSYHTSSLKKYIGEGQSFSTGGKTVRVNSIDTSKVPGTADVSICQGSCPEIDDSTDGPTVTPTDTPSIVPSLSPSREPSNPPVPKPTDPTATPIDVPSALPSASPSHSPSTTPSFPPSDPPVPAGGCGDGICGEDETPESCNSDCPIEVLSLNTAKDTKAKFFCFSLEGEKDVVLTDMQFVAAKDKEGEFEILTRRGGVAGYEFDPGAWETHMSMNLKGKKKMKTEKIDIGSEIYIPAGVTQSFCISSKVGVMYGKNNNSVTSMAKSDGNLKIFSGVEMKKMFDKIKGNGDLDVGISYYVVKPGSH